MGAKLLPQLAEKRTEESERSLFCSQFWLTLLFFALLAFLCGQSFAAEKKPLKVFILAGQSNMEGQAVVDLEGNDYNQGRGTLATLMRDPVKGAMLKHLNDAQGRWTVRDDVWVRYQRERGPLLAGPLGLGFSVYGDALGQGMKKLLAPPTVLFDPVLRDIEGWKVHVEPALIDGEHREEGAKALTIYRNDFYPFVRAELKEHDPALHEVLVKIWGPAN